MADTRDRLRPVEVLRLEAAGSRQSIKIVWQMYEEGAARLRQMMHLLTIGVEACEQVGNEMFSMVVGTEYGLVAHEPVGTGALTPLYR